jgi:hypothetical protein
MNLELLARVAATLHRDGQSYEYTVEQALKLLEICEKATKKKAPKFKPLKKKEPNHY